MVSEHKHYCKMKGKVHYAYVCVEIKLNTSSSTFTRIVIDCHNDEIPMPWLSSAVDGIIEVSDKIVGMGMYNNIIIKLLSVNGIEELTNEDTVRVTATNAIWKALMPRKFPLKLAFINHLWNIEYPALRVVN